MSEIKQKGSSGSGAIYGLGFIGSLIYYITNANSFVDGLTGLLGSLVWPALIVYKLFTFLAQ